MYLYVVSSDKQNILYCTKSGTIFINLLYRLNAKRLIHGIFNVCFSLFVIKKSFMHISNLMKFYMILVVHPHV